MTKRHIERIEPVSAVRMGFFIGLVVGVCFGLLNLYVMRTLSGIAGSNMLGEMMQDAAGMSVFSMVLSVIAAALMSSLFHAALGGVLALVYNTAARYFGGIEVTLTEEAAGGDAGERQSE